MKEDEIKHNLFKLLEKSLQLLDGFAYSEIKDFLIYSDELRQIKTVDILGTLTHPIAHYMQDLEKCNTPLINEIIDIFCTLSPYFKWRQSYQKNDFGDDFLNKYGWVELAGETGYFKSSKFLLSFLALAPHTIYPEHRHPPEEIYLPLTGDDAGWVRSVEKNNPNFYPRKIGDTIYHPSMIWHATQANKKPLLAMAIWKNAVFKKPDI